MSVSAKHVRCITCNGDGRTPSGDPCLRCRNTGVVWPADCTARRSLRLRRTWGRTLAHEYRAGKKPRWDRGEHGVRVRTRGHLA